MKVVLCNCPGAQAETIARHLVQSRVAACVNVIPGVKSFYWWKEELCEEEECTLLIKIRQHDFVKLEKLIREVHPYEVPEIVELTVSDCHGPYLQWLYDNTR